MNYTTASGGGINFTFKQVRLDLSNATWDKLNSSPIQLITPTGKNIVPINYFIDYRCSQAISFPTTVYIGFENCLSANLSDNVGGFDVGAMANTIGKINFGIPYYAAIPTNTDISQPLVLYNNVDNPTIAWDYFYMTITYSEII